MGLKQFGESETDDSKINGLEHLESVQYSPKSLKFGAKVGQKVLLEVWLDNYTVDTRAERTKKRRRLNVDLHQLFQTALPQTIDYQLIVFEEVIGNRAVDSLGQFQSVGYWILHHCPR